MKTTQSGALRSMAVAPAIAFLFAFASPGVRAQSLARPYLPIAIENVSVIDVIKGRVKSPRTVIVEDGRIVAMDVPDKVSIPSLALHVDGRGRYLMPGLIDMHVHLFNNATHRPPNDWMFPLFVANGVLGVREMYSTPAEIPIVEHWRKGLAEGNLIAPRVLAAGIPVFARTVDGVKQEVRVAYDAGADFIKIFSEVAEPIWRAVLEQARQEKLPVYGHVPADVSAVAAARAGQQTEEHLYQIYEACSNKEGYFLATRNGGDGKDVVRLRDEQERQVLDSFDPEACKRVAYQLVRTRSAQVPTLVLENIETSTMRTRFRDDPRWHYLRGDEHSRWERIIPNLSGDTAFNQERLRISLRIAGILHRAGVTIFAGTDTPMPLDYPGWSLHKELEMLVESGMSSADALRASTIAPARFLGLGDVTGSVAVGKRADLLLLDGNPLRKINNTRRIQAVILDGRLLRRSDLDVLLQAAARSSLH